MKHRIAIVGLGMAVAPHAKSLADLEKAGRCVVAAAMAPSEQRRATFAREYPFPTTADLDAVLADRDITAIGILTPPNTHLELVERAARAGKHILLEKPLEISRARAEELVAAAERAGITLAVMLQYRFRPASERLAAILREGRLGEIVNCSTSIRFWRPQSYYDEPGRGTRARDGGGVLITQAIHALDLMLSLVGPVDEVRGFAATSPVHRMETEDLVMAGVRYANGALGTIEATTAGYPGTAERIEIIGTKGSATLVGTALTVDYLDGTREELGAGTVIGGTGADPMAFSHEYHRAAWSDFLDAIEQRRPPRISGREALKVHKLIDALLAAGSSTGRPTQISG
jgi:UDP-N-acetyl-2-amino-2-deoxyglucuronate dehydrogenase